MREMFPLILGFAVAAIAFFILSACSQDVRGCYFRSVEQGNARVVNGCYPEHIHGP